VCLLFVCLAGSLVWASDPARPAGFSPATWVEMDPAKKKTSKIIGFFSRIYICLKKMFSCMLHTANTLTRFEHSSFYIYIYIIFKVLKENVF
jgi:hypothetical protein